MIIHPTLAEELARATAQLELELLNPQLIHAAKRALLDTLGAALAGVNTEEATLLRKAIREWGKGGAYNVWGTGEYYSAADAALANGTAAHAREVDDFGGCGHSGAVVIPAVLAAGQSANATGKDVLAGILAGYEVAVRVMDALGGYRAHNSRGWHSTGTAGVFGAAVGAGRALRLTPEKMAWALGLAGTYTGGIWAFIADGAMSKRLHAGKAAQGGLVAALLAKQGFTGPLAIFEDTWGSYLNVYADEMSNRDALVAGLGKEWDGIFRSGFKPYACCRGIHSSLDAVFWMKKEWGIKADDVEVVVVRGTQQTVRQLGKIEVDTILDAQFSLPYSMALAFVVGKAGLTEYEAPFLRDASLSAFARKVSVIADETLMQNSEPVVEVRLHSGKVITKSVQIPKGDSRNPISDEDLIDKFMLLGQRCLTTEKLMDIKQLVWTIERVMDLSPFYQKLAVPIN